MTGNVAWQRHGCYKLGSEQYFNMPLERAVLGCKDGPIWLLYTNENATKTYNIDCMTKDWIISQGSLYRLRPFNRLRS